MTVEGMLYRMRTGCPWRDLPKAFGNWNKVYKRFNAWSVSGTWLKVFKRLVVEPDLEWAFLDGSYAKAHQHSAGAASGNDEAIGKVKLAIPARFTSRWKLRVCPSSLKSRVDRSMTAPRPSALIAKLPAAETIVADKGHDSAKIREQVERQGAKAVIPRKRNSVKGNADLDRRLCRNWHLVENAFARLKHYRAVASRFDKLKKNEESVVAMAGAFLWLPM
ncbi:IS5 family transposase [Metapseudomonas boanensis]|uniref:IS5 family transposase n=1 Tax=Metapseudomonas boanensis TaxID=2822138 RepID=UPI002041AC64|nr:IS5 family transposase [Pseudomonas boanensis]